jgi:lysine/ornithine N-monooxygenase
MLAGVEVVSDEVLEHPALTPGIRNFSVVHQAELLLETIQQEAKEAVLFDFGGGGISEAEQNQKTCRPQEPHPRQVNTLTRRNEPRHHAKSNGRPNPGDSIGSTLR